MTQSKLPIKNSNLSYRKGQGGGGKKGWGRGWDKGHGVRGAKEVESIFK